MDSNILVTSGQKLVGLLEAGGSPPRAAMWVHNPDTDTWRLWIVPPTSITDKHAFYRQIAEIVSANHRDLLNLDASDVEMLTDSHPAIQGLSRMFKLEGVNDVHVSNNRFNDFYMPDGIILRMSL